MGKIVRLDSLSSGEAIRIEGNISRFSDAELEGMLPTGTSRVSLRSSLARGELVVLSDAPTVPLFTFSNGKLVANTSNQISITDHAFSEVKQRFLSKGPSFGTSKPARTDDFVSFSEANYLPEPVLKEPPPTPIPPTVISDNFSKPAQADKVFAKSCTRPYGDTLACEENLKAPNFGVMAAMVPAQALDASGRLPLTKLTGTTSRMPLNWGLTGEIAKNVAKRANFLALAFWPAQLGDGTLYTDEELAQLPEATTRVRFRLYQDEHGNPQAIGIHTGEGSPYGDTVKRISAEAIEDRFEAKVDEEITLTWYPDDSDKVLTAGTSFPDTSGLGISNILVRPIEDDGQELTTLVYPNPEAEHIELIVTFPADSGIPPLYLVFSSPRNKPGGVTGKGKDVNWSDGYWLGQDANSGQGQYIPTKIADALRDREFRRFSDFQSAFWKEVAKTPELMEQFSHLNQGQIKQGNAPFVKPKFKWKKLKRYTLHHVEQIQHGGEVYNVDNMRVTTPRLHWGEIHGSGEGNNHDGT